MSANFAPESTMFPDIEEVTSSDRLPIRRNTIYAPFDYLQSLPSNNDNIRSKLLEGLNEKFFHIADKQVMSEIVTFVETLHGASLLIDDIEDYSTLRRGSPCAHIKYGVPATLNSGNLMYFVAIQRAVSSLSVFGCKGDDAALPVVKNTLSEIFMEEMINLHTGQGFDIYWRDNLETVMKSGLPTIKEYLQVAMHKTGGLFRLAVRILGMFAFKDSEEVISQKNLIKLANLFGIIYQVRDDHLNLVDERYAQMKGLSGEDLIEGKLSLPILYTLHSTDSSSMLHQFYCDLKSPNERRSNLERVEKTRQFIADAGAMEFSYLLLQEYVGKARLIIEAVEDSSSTILTDILTTLSHVNGAS